MPEPVRQHLLRALTDACRRHYGDALVSLAVFGSWARNAATPYSDLDLLIVAEPLPEGRLARVRQFEPIEAELAPLRRTVWGSAAPPLDISPIFKTPAEVEEGSPLFLDMTRHVLLLHDRNGFFAGYLAALAQRLRELGAERRPFRGGYYWIYKPDARPGEVIRL
ncbi:MAG: nucleotidyltransferase domain-containing protein [Kiritimatiellae bacterium]|nr:nucleotidyltransferase domain-containing protein [Kiritimatiellia bacterium]